MKLSGDRDTVYNLIFEEISEYKVINLRGNLCQIKNTILVKFHGFQD